MDIDEQTIRRLVADFQDLTNNLTEMENDRDLISWRRRQIVKEIAKRCKYQYEVADLLGVSTARISQLLKD